MYEEKIAHFCFYLHFLCLLIEIIWNDLPQNFSIWLDVVDDDGG